MWNLGWKGAIFIIFNNIHLPHTKWNEIFKITLKKNKKIKKIKEEEEEELN